MMTKVSHRAAMPLSSPSTDDNQREAIPMYESNPHLQVQREVTT